MCLCQDPSPSSPPPFFSSVMNSKKLIITLKKTQRFKRINETQTTTEIKTLP